MTMSTEPAADPRPESRIQDMQQLLAKAEEFARTVQGELDELNTMRQTALDTVQKEADEILEEARLGAEVLRGKVDENARVTLDRARSEAIAITQTAHDDAATLREVAMQYRVALEGALATLDNLPELPPIMAEHAPHPSMAAVEEARAAHPSMAPVEETPEPEPTPPVRPFTVIPGETLGTTTESPNGTGH